MVKFYPNVVQLISFIERVIIMSLIDYAMKYLGGVSTTTVICPACGLRSSQSISKIRLKQTMLCPGCKTLFVSPR